MSDQPTSKKSKPGGRTPGTGPYGETTKIMRIPQSAVGRVVAILDECKREAMMARLKGQVMLPAENPAPIHVPMYSHKIPAGFPSPADDYVDDRLSLDQHLIPHRESTYFVRAIGNSMVDAGIFDNDLLVVDRSITPSHGHIVIAVIDGELTVKRLHQKDGETILKPANARFKDIVLQEGQELQVWGVVTSTIKRFV